MSEQQPDAIVRWFRDAAPYINQHRGKTFVVYFSGEITETASFETLIHDLGLLHALGIKLVLMYGARPQIEARLNREGIKAEYAQGLRITDSKTLDPVIEVIGRLRVLIEARLSLSLANTPMSGSRIRVCSGNYISAKPLGVLNGVDFQHTGEVRRVDAAGIQAQLDSDEIVLCSPLGYSPTGEVFNLRSEDVACQVAISLNAEKLIYLYEQAPPTEIPSHLTSAEVDQFSQLENLPSETASMLRASSVAAQAGVRRAHLIDRRLDGALLTELFTRDGHGTMITEQVYDNLRAANIEDIAGILELIKPLEDKGVLVRRSREQLELEVERFFVIEREGTIIACVAMFPFANDDTAELACLVVHDHYRGTGRADLLLTHIEKTARQQNIQRLVVLSTQTIHWFIERGFQEGSVSDLPQQKANLYNLQRRSKVAIKNIS